MFRQENNIVVAKFVEGEIIENLKNLMKEIDGRSALIINGVGQLESVTIGYFDGNEYIKKKLDDVFELVSLQGNIGMSGNNYIVHAHVSLGNRNHEIIGGHLIEGKVKTVNEISLLILKEIEIRREKKGNLMEMFI